ncbi:MAG: WecB/TagA/CpsF family glycosyltransferase [Hydrococcus sp. RU_2_2]|jgi:N-acetylglucosaminyldiphosphoundecaprenol N-acetyl-beta-D-mannosaminyltransferase|nr:WecB/TagA/CpsF family glycosyltransferase [Hydrococcus sp. RU_2_2]NJP17904.1 WecB/TagA/CpsF family glycosyltransferase [Hydrococcus sp. CRU_1_1]
MILQSSIPTKYVLNFPVTALRFDEQIYLLLKWARARESKMVCLANVHMIMEAYWNPMFATVLNSADIVAPDGMPLVWMLRQMGIFGQNRVAGMDVFLRLCELSQLSKISIFFLGSQQTVLDRIKKRLLSEFPNVQIAGMEPLPFRPLSASEDTELIQKINQSGAGLVFICLGCPKQENWMYEHRNKIQAVMLGLGAVFPLYAGLQKRAPFYIRESGLEWLYRLIQEPQRLWHRYGKTIPPFMWLSLQQLLVQLGDRASPELIEKLYAAIIHQPSFELDVDCLELNADSPKIGEILLRQNLVSDVVLSTALEEQRLTKKKLGEILVERGYISPDELEYYLQNQKIKLGELLVQNHIISQAKLNKLLDLQQSNHCRLGEVIIQQKILSPQQLEQFLREQYWRKQGLWLMPNTNNIHEAQPTLVKTSEVVV